MSTNNNYPIYLCLDCPSASDAYILAGSGFVGTSMCLVNVARDEVKGHVGPASQPADGHAVRVKEGLLQRVCREQPLMQIRSADAERIVETLIGPAP